MKVMAPDPDCDKCDGEGKRFSLSAFETTVCKCVRAIEIEAFQTGLLREINEKGTTFNHGVCRVFEIREKGKS